MLSSFDKFNNIFWELLAVKRQIATFAYCLNWSSKLVKIGVLTNYLITTARRGKKSLSVLKKVWFLESKLVASLHTNKCIKVPPATAAVAVLLPYPMGKDNLQTYNWIQFKRLWKEACATKLYILFKNDSVEKQKLLSMKLEPQKRMIWLSFV